MWTDFSRALRSFSKHPSTFVAAVASLALAFAVNVAAFTVLDAILLRKLPVHKPEQLIHIGTTNAAGATAGLTFQQFRQISQQTKSLSGVISWYGDRLSNIEVRGQVIRAGNWFVSDDFYAQHGTAPLLGRLLGAADVNLQSVRPEPVAVIGYSLWQRVWWGDPRALGDAIKIEGVPFTVVGIAPQGFTGFSVTNEPDVTVPVTARALIEGRPAQSLTDQATFTLNVIGRLRDGVSIDAARAELDVQWPEIRRQSMPSTLLAALREPFLATPLAVSSAAAGIERIIRDRFGFALQVIFGLSCLVLLLGSANIAALLLTRTVARRGELAMLKALGASTARIALNVASDAFVLVGAAVLIGAPLAFWMVRAMMAFMFTDFVLPVALDLSLGAGTAGYIALMACVSCLILAAVSWWWLRSAQLTKAMAQHSSRTVAPQHLSGSVLAALQVALAVAILGVGTVLIRSLAASYAIPLGYDGKGVTVVQPYPKPGGYRGLNDNTYDRDLIAQVSAIPGVKEAAISSLNPAGGTAPSHQVQALGESAEVSASFSSVSPGLFALLRIPVTQGRDVAWTDDARAPRVAVISESLSQRLFTGRSPLGQRLRVGTHPTRQSIEIVGVVADSRLYDARRENLASVYVSHVQEGELGRWKTIVVRTAANIDLQPGLRAALEPLGREYLLYARTLDYQTSLNLKDETLAGRVAAFFGGLALLIAGLGVFGCLAFSVTTRTREIGTRVALGATPRDVLRLVGRHAGVVYVAGVALGVAGALAGQRFVRTLLYGVTAQDAVSVVVALVLLGVAVAIATAIPAARALRMDPATTLRDA
jgi:putative ABC transport system permease protein